MFNYYRINGYRNRKLVLSVLVCSLEAMIKCVAAFNEFYDKLVITNILTGKEEKDDE